MGGTCSTYGELGGSVGVSEGKKPLASPRCRWENNFKMGLPIKNSRHGLIWLRIKTDGFLFST
jgi:hypothetical protein